MLLLALVAPAGALTTGSQLQLYPGTVNCLDESDTDDGRTHVCSVHPGQTVTLVPTVVNTGETAFGGPTDQYWIDVEFRDGLPDWPVLERHTDGGAWFTHPHKPVVEFHWSTTLRQQYIPPGENLKPLLTFQVPEAAAAGEVRLPITLHTPAGFQTKTVVFVVTPPADTGTCADARGAAAGTLGPV